YFWRRVTRLEPPYFLSLILLFIVKVIAGRGTAAGLFPSLMASIFYVHNAAFGAPSDINYVAWSLEIEIQFYLLAPVLALIFVVKSASVRRSVLIAAILLGTWIGRLASSHPHLQLSLIGYAQYFFAGFLMTEFYLDRGSRRKSPLWDFAAIGSGSLLLFLLVRAGGQPVSPAPCLILLIC